MTGFQTRSKTDTIVIHCSATKPDMDIGARDITAWHLKRGFSTIGYHYVIRRDGTVESGRPIDAVGAHVEGHNLHSVGICMVGGLGKDGKPAPEYTPAQWTELKRLVLKILERFPGCKIVGHRDLPGVAKACPSFDVAHWIKENIV